MRTIIEKINAEQAQQIKKDNSEYLVWNNEEPITVQEIMQYFKITKYGNGNINLEYKDEDFRILNIKFTK